jgi:hypothetical protein
VSAAEQGTNRLATDTLPFISATDASVLAGIPADRMDRYVAVGCSGRSVRGAGVSWYGPAVPDR